MTYETEIIKTKIKEEISSILDVIDHNEEYDADDYIKGFDGGRLYGLKTAIQIINTLEDAELTEMFKDYIKNNPSIQLDDTDFND